MRTWDDDLMPLKPSGAVFSQCRTWRYALSRDLGSGEGTAVFVGLNPSTADETADDPTIRRCIGYARDWGFRRLIMCNLFALRSTDPAGLLAVPNPVGPANDHWLRRCAEASAITVCAWGRHGHKFGRGGHVAVGLLAHLPLHILTLNRDGSPAHPLYQKRGLVPQAFIRPARPDAEAGAP